MHDVKTVLSTYGYRISTTTILTTTTIKERNRKKKTKI
jgi:hypothetical protein